MPTGGNWGKDYKNANDKNTFSGRDWREHSLGDRLRPVKLRPIIKCFSRMTLALPLMRVVLGGSCKLEPYAPMVCEPPEK